MFCCHLIWCNSVSGTHVLNFSLVGEDKDGEGTLVLKPFFPKVKLITSAHIQLTRSSHMASI